MAKKLLVDTGFWYALYDNRDGRHQDAQNLADWVIRLAVEDRNTKIDAIITFNPKDFLDVCQRSGVELLSS
ncbi:MAG: hypothetical protein ACP5IL_00800 [Syntrophobacteraceae bacterium]